MSTAEKAFDEDLTAEERADKIIDATQAFGTVIPGAALAAQVANVGETSLGAFNTFGGDLSDEDKVKRLKTRYLHFRKELDELYGPTQKETGKLDRQRKPVKKEDKAVKRKKDAALADKLRTDLTPLTPEFRKMVLQSIDPSEHIEKLALKSISKSTP